MSHKGRELRIDLGKARDQGARPTCLSFALSEIHRSAINFEELLSPASLHCHATKRALKSSEMGLTVSEAANALQHDGQTTELAWPYDMEASPQSEYVCYQTSAVSEPFSEKAILDLIQDGTPIGLIIDIDLSFFRCNGSIALSLSSEQIIEGRHAVVICGLRTASPGMEYLIKNSWGDGWGSQGYAWLTRDFIVGRSPQLVRI